METLGFPLRELLFLAPEILLVMAGLLLLLGARGRGLSGREAALVAGASLVLAGLLVLRVQAALEGRESLALLGGLFVLDGLTFLVKLLVLLATFLTMLLSLPVAETAMEAEEGRARAFRSPGLLLLAAAGLLVLASGGDLLALGIGLQIPALAGCRLAGPLRRPARSVEGLLESWLPPALSSGLLLAGMALRSLSAHWQPVVAGLAAAAMIGGSLAALARGGARRLLAASSIAHTGSLLAGLLVADGTGRAVVLFYLLASTVAILGALGAAVLHERRNAGSARPLSVPASTTTLLFLLALAGLPPAGGFVAKLGLLAAVLQGWSWLAVLGALASAVSLSTSFRLLAGMSQSRMGPEATASPRAPAVVMAIAVCAAMTLALGLVPGPFLEWVESLGPAARR